MLDKAYWVSQKEAYLWGMKYVSRHAKVLHWVEKKTHGGWMIYCGFSCGALDFLTWSEVEELESGVQFCQGVAPCKGQLSSLQKQGVVK